MLPMYLVLFVLVWGLAPVAVPFGWIIDRIRRKHVLASAWLFFGMYLFWELVGVLVALFIWLACGTWLGGSRHRFLRWNFKLQCFWVSRLYHSARILFRMRVEVTGDTAVSRGNMLFFIRHASTADTVLPGVFVSARYGIFLRYVLKDELLWDPCIDIVGNRLPNGFVSRGRGNHDEAIAEVTRLTRDLGPAEGVLIYPEGTRFSPGKRARRLARLEQKNETEQLEWARELSRVLPPRLAGPLALLDNAPDVDVVFCAHSGLEQAMSFKQFLAGGMYGITLRITFWRVPAADIPRERRERIKWLYTHWRRIDQWLGSVQK